MSRWFRHYAGMMRDEKLVRVAVRSKQSVERVIWVWGAILESAAEINDNGRYEFDTGEASYFLRCDGDEIAIVLAELEHAGRLVEGVVARWGDRQFSSDAGAERQRRYRERKNAKSDSKGLQANRNGDGEVTSRDVDVTPQETETETDTYTKANALDAASPVDARDALWTDGLSILRALTGKPEAACRSLIGKWLKATRDDCAIVLSKIKTAQADRIGEPVPWITAAVQATAPPNRLFSALEGIKSGKLDVGDLLNGKPHDIPTIDGSYERTDRGGIGHFVQDDALSSGRRS